MLKSTSRLLAAAAMIAAATAIAACGASSSPSTTSSGAQPSAAQRAQAQRDPVRFAVCLRSHGVPNVPDPTNPRQFKTFLGNNQSPAAQTAEAACRHLLPGGGQSNQSAAPTHAQITAILAFARCMRGHGFPRFPDPTTGGEVSHEMLANAGIDIHLPSVRTAADACTAVTHGLLTRADVARFIAGH
jgi:hypothetical protein